MRVIILAMVIICVMGAAAHIGSYRVPIVQSLPADPTLQASSTSQVPDGSAELALRDPRGEQKAPPPPPPPPAPPQSFLVNEPVAGSPPEPPRTLIGTTRKQLAETEQYLPKGAQVFTSAVGMAHLKAALVKADIDGDGVVETIVVHTERRATAEEPRPPIRLTVLSRNGESLSVRMSISLIGNVLFNVEVNGVVGPLAVRDVSGDGRPEIIVASGGSPSLGGWLQAFDVSGTSFRKVAYINGRYFRVTAASVGRASAIAARWMEEDQATIYNWNGQEFEATNKH